MYYNTNKVILLSTRYSWYTKERAMIDSITVGELIEFLKSFDEDTKVVFSNDGGYTYGEIFEKDFEEVDLTEEN